MKIIIRLLHFLGLYWGRDCWQHDLTPTRETYINKIKQIKRGG